MENTLPTDYIGAEFVKHEGQIRRAVSGFVRRYGGDWNDYFSEAQFIFLRAIQSWKRDGGVKLHVWLSYKIWYGLKDFRDREGRHHELTLNETAAINLREPVYASQEKLTELLETFGDAAYEVAQLIIDPPPDVLLDLKERERDFSRKPPDKLRSVVYSLLRDLGWTPKEIAGAFKEIADIVMER